MKGPSGAVRIPSGAVHIEALLEWPAESPGGVVLFAHGSGSGRLSPRNGYVAGELRQAGLATLLMDLLTAEEDRDHARRFDIPLLGRRLADALAWIDGATAGAGLPVGLFGASTGAAAALCLAAAQPARIGAVVSRGGRPDLADEQVLAAVRAPTLLIVGGLDADVIELNRAACRGLDCLKELALVPGATHLFEEPGALQEVAGLAAAWFRRHLRAEAEAAGGSA